MNLEQFSNGIILSNPLNVEREDFERKKSLQKRGKIKQFTSKSRARLLDLLLRVQMSRPCAITLTIPRNVPDFRALCNRFFTNLRSRGFSAIWRVELQTRGVPHLHMVADISNIDSVGEFWYCWILAVDYEGLSSIRGFLQYGASFRWLDGSGWFKYLSLHTGKHKTTQLGWVGRQWGVVNRSGLKINDSFGDIFQVLPGHEEKVCRIFRWIARYRDFHSDFFGSRKFFLSNSEIQRIKARHCFNLPF